MKVYLNYFKLYIISTMQYRLPAIAGILTQFFFGFVFILVYIGFYESNNTTGLPMDLSSLVTYLWLQQAFYALIFPFSKDNELLGMIKNGNVAYELLRPQNFFLKYYSKTIAKKTGATFLRSWFLIVVTLFLPAPFKLGLPKTGFHFIIFIISLIFASLLISAITVIVHLITMFTIDSKGIISIYHVLADLFMGSIIPLPFLPNFILKISNFLPFRFIEDFPFRIYSGNIDLTHGMYLLLGSIFWIIISIIIGLILSKKVLRKAVIQGG